MKALYRFWETIKSASFLNDLKKTCLNLKIFLLKLSGK
jgi:hypothetical protein